MIEDNIIIWLIFGVLIGLSIIVASMTLLWLVCEGIMKFVNRNKAPY